MPFTLTLMVHIKATIIIPILEPASAGVIFLRNFNKFYRIQILKACSTNCFSCSQANPTLCTECVYSKARFSSLTTFYNALSTTGAVDCSTMSSRSSTATLTYYLRPQGTACPTTPCANTVTDYTTYYDSFYDIMTDVKINIKKIENFFIYLF